MVSSTVGLADVDRLEAALERGVLLDVLAVLVERGGADAAQLAAGEGMGLSRLPAASIAPSAAPAPTIVCSSSMKRMTARRRPLTSRSTALRRSSNSPRNLAPAISCADVERDDAGVAHGPFGARRR